MLDFLRCGEYRIELERVELCVGGVERERYA